MSKINEKKELCEDEECHEWSGIDGGHVVIACSEDLVRDIKQKIYLGSCDNNNGSIYSYEFNSLNYIMYF